MVLVKRAKTKMELATLQKSVKQKAERILEVALPDMVFVAHVNIIYAAALKQNIGT